MAAPVLVVRIDSINLLRCVMNGDEVIVGREESCDIRCADKRVAPRHLRIWLHSGALLVDALDHGVCIGGRELVPGLVEPFPREPLVIAGALSVDLERTGASDT